MCPIIIQTNANRILQIAQKKLQSSQVALNEAVARLGSSMATGEMEVETAANEVCLDITKVTCIISFCRFVIWFPIWMLLCCFQRQVSLKEQTPTTV